MIKLVPSVLSLDFLSSILRDLATPPAFHYVVWFVLGHAFASISEIKCDIPHLLMASCFLISHEELGCWFARKCALRSTPKTRAVRFSASLYHAVLLTCHSSHTSYKPNHSVVFADISNDSCTQHMRYQRCTWSDKNMITKSVHT